MTTPDQAFSLMAVEAMNRAYDKACKILKAEGADRSIQIKAGERIMVLARNGVTDEHRLCSLAVQDALKSAPVDGAGPPGRRRD